MRNLKTVKEVDTAGKKVLVRADLDVPMEEGKVGDDFRLKALLPTLTHLIDSKARILIIGHLGRPEGKDSKLTLAPVAKRLSRLLDRKVDFVGDIDEVGEFEVAMLENLRFWPGEEKNDPSFVGKLASLASIYVNESFATVHRSHASTYGVAEELPAFSGLSLAKEVEELGGVLEDPQKPLVFVLGGAKTETKAPLVKDFAKISDVVLLGGLLMFRSDLEGLEKVVFPTDALDIYDIGPKSIKTFVEEIAKAKTVVWNGPVGKWEDSRYELGTRAIAEELSVHSGKSIIGGGDTIAALSSFNLLDDMDHVSLGGGSMLEFLAGKKLPALEALGYYEA